MGVLFTDCYPNTLDTTVYYTAQDPDFGGRPDTFIITGDIPAMWQRDSTNQVRCAARGSFLHTAGID